MSIDMFTAPRYKADHLGLPMPDDPHAVSACLPLWRHNIGYEEGDLEVHEKLQAAYPRFCFHPYVQQLCEQFLNTNGRKGLPFVSTAAADRAMRYIWEAGHVRGEIIPIQGQSACGVVVPRDDFHLLKQYWQHAGENVSSRVAEQILTNQPATVTNNQTRILVRHRVAALYENIGEENIFLFTSGMSAIAAAWRTAMSFSRSAAGTVGWTCQFGFPYVDTLKIQQRFPEARHIFLPVGGADDIQALARQCDTEPPVAVFCEVPTNPLLMTPNLAELREMANRYGFLLVVDDTLGACRNLNVLPFADLIVTSLTKYFSGYGNVLAGSLVINTRGPHAADLKKLVSDDFEETLSDADVEVLKHNSSDIDERIDRINSNAASLQQFLSQHPKVEHVYYPSSTDDAFALLKRPDRGAGGLLSIVLKNAPLNTPPVFDNLRVCKGPNLGTNFTLCCPYTILAHYDELDFVESCGVSRWLLRISVGTESIDDLKTRFAEALSFATH